jgi:hypothetical protein
MASDTTKSDGWTCLELHCSGQQLKTSSISFTQHGPTYRVSCGPLGDRELELLQRAAGTGEFVRLVFPQSAVVLANVTVEYPKPGWAQLEGLVVGAPTRDLLASRPSAND